MDLIELKNQLLDNINSASLPVDGVYYMVRDLLNDITIAYNNYKANAAADQKVSFVEDKNNDKEEDDDRNVE